MKKEEIINSIQQKQIQRIWILGLPGSGKSTLARFINQSCGHAHIEVDNLYWKNIKGQSVRESFLLDLQNEIAKPKWVIEGHFGKIKNSVVGAELVVVLEPPIWLIYLRLLKRDFFRNLSGKQSGSDFIFVLKNREVLKKQLQAAPAGVPFFKF